MSLMDNLGLAAKVANLPVGWQAKLLSYAVVGVVCLVIGGLGGYKAGSAIMYQQEDKKVDACKEQVNAAIHATEQRYLEGQASVSENKAKEGEARLDSETKRKELLATSVDPQPILIVDPSVSPADPKARKSVKARATAVVTPSNTARPQPEPVCTSGVTQASVRVINHLLEISNETGFYDTSDAPGVDSGGLHDSPRADAGDVLESSGQADTDLVEVGPSVLLTITEA